jgi:hypothetical protein
VRHLEEVIARSTHRRGVYYDTSQTLQSMGRSATGGKYNHLAMFDRKVSEADTYLQMMIDQTTKIEQRIEAIESEEEREKLQPLQQQANEMLDHIKHSIVLLQIAKVSEFDECHRHFLTFSLSPEHRGADKWHLQWSHENRARRNRVTR